MHYRVTVADAIEAHESALSFGGRRGVVDLGLLDSALSRPYSGYHVPISRKAAALLHSVVKNHAFVDGNKRTAWQVTDLLLRRSGYDLEVKPDDRIDDMVVAVADNRMDFDEIVQWFKQRIIRVGK